MNSVCDYFSKERRSARQTSLPTAPMSECVQQVCDELIGLRRGAGFFGNNEIIGGSATIGGNLVVALLYYTSPNNLSSKINGYGIVQHFLELATKFERPLIVFANSETSLQGLCADPHQALGLSKHIYAQSLLQVPIILTILSQRSSSDIFGAWIPDKIISLQQTLFKFPSFDQEGGIGAELEAKSLLHHGIINQMLPVEHRSFTAMPKPARLKAALSKMMREISDCSSKELTLRRKQRMQRILEIGSRPRNP